MVSCFYGEQVSRKEWWFLRSWRHQTSSFCLSYALQRWIFGSTHRDMQEVTQTCWCAQHQEMDRWTSALSQPLSSLCAQACVVCFVPSTTQAACRCQSGHLVSGLSQGKESKQNTHLPLRLSANPASSPDSWKFLHARRAFNAQILRRAETQAR